MVLGGHWCGGRRFCCSFGQESLAIACESIKRIRADMGGTNILSPLKWVIRQPIHRGHPRLLFLLTDGAISNTGKVLELLRNHSCSTRYGGQQGSPLRGQKPGTVGAVLLLEHGSISQTSPLQR